MDVRRTSGASSSAAPLKNIVNPAVNKVKITATPLLGYVFVRATLHTQDVSQLPIDKSSNRLFIVLDCSGSMANGSLKAAQNALCDALPALLRDFTQVHLIPFNSKCVSTDLAQQPLPEARAKINRLRARGRTNFAAFFDVVCGLLHIPDKHTMRDATSVVVLSDGADNHGLDEPHARGEAVRSFQRSVRELAPVSQVHAIGLGRKHDASMMAMLATVGAVSGTFTFARGASQVGSALTDQLCIATQSVLPASVVLYTWQAVVQPSGDADFVHRAGGSDDDGEPHPGRDARYADTGFYELEAFIQTEVTAFHEASVWIGDEQIYAELTVEMSFEAHMTGSLYIDDASLQQFCAKARLLASRLATNLVSEFPLRQFDPQFVSGKHGELADLSSKLFEHVLPQCARNKAAKADIFHALSVLRQLMADVTQPRLRDAPLDNVRYAVLVDLAYGDVRNKRLRGLLQKRAIANRKRLERLETDISHALSHATKNALADRAVEYGRCLYGLTSAPETLKNGDCLCLALDIRRPEAAIADPSRLIVHAVGPSVISSDALLHALQMRLLDSYSCDTGFEVHGGFEKVRFDAEIVPGVARESITGGLPLFVNAAHWKVARLRAQPLLGWMFTLDMLGFTPEQLRVLPFLVLDKVRFGTDVTRFYTRVTRWVFDVCAAVLRENDSISRTLFGGSHGHKLRYINDPTARLPDVVSSNKVLAMYLHVYCKVCDMQVSERNRRFMAFLMVVEQLRRVRHVRQTLNNSSIREAALRGQGELTRGLIAGVDEDAIARSVSDATERSNEMEPSRSVSLETFRDGRRREFSHEERCSGSSQTPHPRRRWDASRKPTGELKQTLRVVASLTAQVCPRLDLAWDMTHAKRVCAVDLAVAWPTAASIRSDAATFQRACEHAFDHSVAYMDARASEAAENISRRVERHMLRLRGAESDAVVARLFLETPDMNEAAGLVRGWLYVGRNVSLVVKVLLGLPHRGMEMTRVKDASSGVESIVQRLVETRSPLMKMRLLCQGSLGEVQELHADQDAEKRRDTFGGLAWRPRKKWVRMLFKKLVLDVHSADNSWDGVIQARDVANWAHEFPWVQRELRIWAREREKR